MYKNFENNIFLKTSIKTQLVSLTKGPELNVPNICGVYSLSNSRQHTANDEVNAKVICKKKSLRWVKNC